MNRRLPSVRRVRRVREIVDGELGAGEPRGMLRLRRAELEKALAEAGARLAQAEGESG